MKIQSIMDVMEKIAPPEMAEEWDNPGLLLGHPAWETDAAVCALDLSDEAIDLAIETKARLIIAHHPILFTGTKAVREDSYEGRLIARMIRNEIAFYAAHTNLDLADGGVGDCLAGALLLQNIRGDGYVRMGDTKQQSAEEYGSFVEKRLGTTTVVRAKKGAKVSRIAVVGGAGGSYFKQAAALGADGFVTGEIHHDEILEALDMGLSVFVAGHLETERVVLEPLKQRLNEMTGLEIHVSR